MPRPQTIQWNAKQYLGDNRVLAMDWDARGMHHWLLNISIQETPPGSLPNDMAAIRRWLGSPSDDIWRRVQSQVFAAWTLRDGRWFNSGMVETFERKERYAGRYEIGTKNHRKDDENHTVTKEEVVVKSPKQERPSFEEVRDYCLERKNGVDPQKWLDHYSANGWKVGRNPMKDWKAAVRTWEQDRPKPQQKVDLTPEEEKWARDWNQRERERGRA